MYMWTWLQYAELFGGVVAAFCPYKPAESEATRPHALTLGRKPSKMLLGQMQPRDVKMTLKRNGSPSKSHTCPRSVAKTNAMLRRSQNQVVHSSGTFIKRDNEYNIVTAAQPSQTNSVAVDEDGTDFSYFTAIRFGSSRKLMYMLIDTGAANTWVMGANCTSEACEKHNTFGDKDSDTLKATGDAFNLTYGTGSVSGMTVNDTAEIAGMSVPLSFGAASITSDDFLTYPVDGILGLGRSASNTMEYPTAMEAIQATGSLDYSMFGVYLQRNGDGSTDGELNFGVPDSSKYTGELSYTDTNPEGGMWEIPLDDASFDSKPYKFGGKSAILDTGTSFILMPPDDAQRLHAQIPQSEQDGETFNIPCSTDIPLQVIISKAAYNISAEDYVGKPVKGPNLCASNIVGRQAFGPDQWLLGDVFLKNVYTVFDFEKNRIGFGVKDAAQSTLTLTSQSATSIVTTCKTSSAAPTILLPEGANSDPVKTSSTPGLASSSSRPTNAALPSRDIPSSSYIFPTMIYFLLLILTSPWPSIAWS